MLQVCLDLKANDLDITQMFLNNWSVLWKYSIIQFFGFFLYSTSEVLYVRDIKRRLTCLLKTVWKPRALSG